jgi:Mg2+ and Co2+ transporter CorA
MKRDRNFNMEQTFNLIAIKESQAVERLTRTTILLAKLTILFLPVSLMTGYFSVQIQDLQGVYTHKTYWVCFAILMFLSIMYLFVFGWISGIVEGNATYQPLSKKFWAASMKAFGRRKKEPRW